MNAHPKGVGPTPGAALGGVCSAAVMRPVDAGYPAIWIVRGFVVAAVLSAGCQQAGAGVDPMVCIDEVYAAQQDIASAMDTSQMYPAVDRVLTAENAEDNLRGCGGMASDIATARMVTCEYLAMTTPGDFISSLVPDLQRRCCPSTVPGLHPWCATYDAGVF